MKYLITGGAGFIGSHLTDRLLGDGHDVVVVDNLKTSSKENNIKQHKDNAHYRFYISDIEDKEKILSVFKAHSFDAVIHLAARAGVRSSLKNPEECFKTNVLGTLNVLECMRESNVKKLVLASSSSVYGNCKAEKFSEDLSVAQPISPYAATKLACEQLCYNYHHLYGLNVMVLRLFNVYGPRLRSDLAIYKFAEKMKSEETIQMYGDGSTQRDYTYIDDIITGILGAMNYTGSGFEIINLGNGHPITLKQMIQTLERLIGKSARIEQVTQQPGDVDKTFCDWSKAHTLLNYTPKTSFEEGIKKTVDWLKKSEII